MVHSSWDWRVEEEAVLLLWKTRYYLQRELEKKSHVSFGEEVLI
jgi:hypothetical protein